MNPRRRENRRGTPVDWRTRPAEVAALPLKIFNFPFRAMGSVCEVRLYAADGSQAQILAGIAQAEVRRLEKIYSRYLDDSVTTRINRSAGEARGVEVDAETAGLLDYAHAAWEQSEGLFDITSGVLRRVWDFKTGRIPLQGEVDETLQLIGWSKVRWQRPRITLPLKGMELDFGGYVKEYAADRAARARGGPVGMRGIFRRPVAFLPQS